MKRFSHWLLCLLLILPGLIHGGDSVVVISEIHYHPADNDEEEFIELHNLFSVDVDLSNWSLAGAVDYQFPNGTTIPAGGYLVIARNPSALAAATGHSGALGPWTGALNNSGEKVKLVVDSIGERTMDEVDYTDSGQWPMEADGSGASLEKLKVNLPGNLASSWSHSLSPNGSPGTARSSTTLPTLALNEIAAVSDNSFFIEIHNHGTSSINLNGYVLSSSDDTRNDITINSGTLAAGGFVSVNAATLGYTPADEERLFLYSTGKAQVIDAIKAGNFAKARYPDGSGRFQRPTTTTPAAANSVSLQSDIIINEIFYHGYPDPGTDGTPATYNSTSVIQYSDSWRYENTGAGQSAGWANSVHNGWPSGASLIGHEPHTGNLPPQTIQTSLYTSGQMTYYFEKEFTFNGTTADALIRLTHKIDDGAVFYLNGVELGRYHMPSGTITPTTPASGAIELTEVVATFPASSLVQGSNRLSVEVHQATSNSSDMVFGLQAEILAETAPAIPGLPYQESGEEWIELHNKGNSTINLGGWKLDDAVDFEFDANTSIAPGGYLVIAKNPTAFTAKYPSATVVGPWSGTLSNSGERIQLEDQNGNLADEVTYYDGGRWSSFADGGGCSLELTDPRSDNGLPEQWEPSATNAGWNTYTYQAVAVDNGFGKNNFNEFLLGMLDAGEVLLDDVSVIEDPDGSPIELIVNGDFSGDAIGSNPSGWRMAGNHGLHGKSVVVSDGGNKVLRLISTGASREFHNHIQTDFASNRQIVAGRTYRISYRAKWLRGDNQVNTRFFTDWLSNTKRLAVDQNAGTPGQANSVAVANAGPSISNLTHSPVIPSANQAVTVRCLIEDPDGISNALVRFRKNNSSGFSSVSMVHQGGGIYQGTIPGSSGGSVCQFYIDASDAHSGSAASATFPKEGPDSRAMFQWQDGQANTSTLHNLRIIMHPSDRQLMETDINRMSNYRFPATLIVDETEVYYNIGARLKGSAAGRFGSSATGMNLGFDNMQLYNGVHKSISIERGGIDIQHFAKHLMCSSGKGMSGMFDDPIRLVFPSDVLGNAGRTGIALVSAARYSSAWRKSQFKNGNDGTVYNFELLYNPLQKSGSWKKNNPYDHARGVYEFRDLPLGKETYRWGFQIRSNLRRDNYEPLINTSKAMGLGGSASVSELEKYIDVNQWARTWAYMGLVGNDDTYTRIFDHNFRMYSRPSDDRLVALPWDLDRAFRIGTNSNLIGNDNLGAYLNQPTVRRLFMQHVHDLCTSTFTSAYAAPWAAHFASKTGLNYNAERNYVINRSNYALSQLPANVNFAIQTNSGANFSVNASTTLLEGDGWINVAEIEINGTPAEVNWVDDDTWQLDVPLAVGANPITLTARDLNGVQVGSDSITITNTSITDLASSANLVLTELMYHPADPTVAEQTAGYTSDDDFEFIELMNISSNEIDLSGCAFTDGITFTVPSGTLLPAGARLVIASNPAAFASRYDDVGKQVIGGYTGKLSNSGETLTFISANTSTIFTVTYSDAGDWPEDADGDGYSLVNLLPVSGTDLDSPQNWSPSRELGGGSGLPDLYTYDSWLADFPQLAAASMTAESDDFDQDGYNNLLEFALHSDPTDSASTPAMPSAISNIDPGTGTADYFTFSITRPIATPGVSYTPETSMTLNNDWDNNAMTNYAVLYSRTRNGDVETLTYRSKNPASAESRHFFRMKVEKETP